jgi:glycosyltransferase involved in cell wall biosynthesis
MTKILQIANYTESKGGIASQVKFLLEAFCNHPYQSSLFNTKTTKWNRTFLIFKLLKESRQFDVLHIHGCSGLGFYPIVIGIIAGKFNRKRTILTYHGGGLETFISKYPRIVKLFLRNADLVTVPSKFIEQVFLKHGIQVLNLPNIIREENVSYMPRERIRPRLIVTRSLEGVYNIPLAIKSFALIQKKIPDAQLTIVGDGSKANDLKQFIKENNIENIVFTGRVRNSDIGTTLNEADIFLNPSNEDNMPFSLFEAFACGLPVVSTNVGGIPDFIDHGINGLLVPKDDEIEMSNSIEFLLKNPLEAQKIAERGYLTFKDFTWENLCSSYIELYESK